MRSVESEGVSWSKLSRGGAINAGAAVVASVAGLVVVLLAGRTMSPGTYAAFASVWGLIFGGAAVLGALEQESARRHSLLGAQTERTQLLVTAVIATGATVCMGLLVIVLYRPLHIPSPLVAILIVVTTTVFSSMFTARGFLAGALRFSGLAAVTAGEALVRLAVVLIGFAIAFAPVPTVALGALCGAFAGVPVLARGAHGRAVLPDVWPSVRRTLTLMVGNGLSAVLLTGAPVLVGLAMTSAAVTDTGRMQAAVVVSRFPLIGLQLLQSMLIPVFVRRRSLLSSDYPRLVLALVCAVPVAAVASALAGPWFLRLLYGSGYAIRADQISLLTAGATALGGVQVLVALAVSGDRHRLSPLAFGPTLAITVLVALVAPLDTSMRVPVALAVGPVTGFLTAVVATRRWRRDDRTRRATLGPGGVPSPSESALDA